MEPERTNEQLRTVDAVIVHGPYLNAPAWPWFAAGWALGALFVLLLVLARALA